MTAPDTGARHDGITVFHGGPVWLAPGIRTTALAVTGGIISAHGDEALALTAAETVDLAGKLLIPAFNDGHCHPVMAGLETFGPLVSELDSVDAVVAEVARFAAENPHVEWIIGGAYDPSVVPEGRFDAAWLDAVVPGRPVMLHANDHHTVWCNSEALRRAGVTAETPEPVLGRIERRDAAGSYGTPLGTLREWHAIDLMRKVAPAMTIDEGIAALEAACRIANAEGIAWMQDAWVERGEHTLYLEAVRRGALTVRTNLAFRIDPDNWREDIAIFAAARAEVEALGRPDLLTAKTAKFFVDGVIEGGTAEMLAPYCGTHDHGLANWDRESLIEAVTALDAVGFQAHLHAIGDAAIRHALDAVEAANEANPGWDRRPVITHVQLVHKDDLHRFAKLDVIANFQAFWAQEDNIMRNLDLPRLGQDRYDQQYPIATLDEMGTRISFASDWPVTPNDFVATISVAATRQTAEGLPAGGWTPHEQFEVEKGLLAATAGSAYQGFTDDWRGTLAVGQAADLVVLGADITTADPLAMRSVRPEATYLSGILVYARE
ncbi:Exoenzymes regulatory protein AepA precursor [Leifsonia rubra CMS 76R]|nr:Exoenzymes regulatory protein AepA precursor [Leifsonia rubra CMS 76R]